jgi:hypothetical protein
MSGTGTPRDINILWGFTDQKIYFLFREYYSINTGGFAERRIFKKGLLCGVSQSDFQIER